jgi:hypothetical protein
MADKTESKRTVSVTKKTVNDLKPKRGKSAVVTGGPLRN